MTGLEIAIIGMAGRFPGARNLREFWANLVAGKESISFFSDEELLLSGVSPEMIARPEYVRARGILEAPESFDAGFFKFTPREAEITDPQHRCFLECAWEACEDAGYVPDAFGGYVGVFAAAATSSYFFHQVIPGLGSDFAFGDTMSVLGNEKDFLPTRLSYKLGLKGPSVTVSTGCSSSLVATHLACKSLLAGECDMALAGGVSIRFPAKMGYPFQEGGIASPDGHCRTFDEQARGSVFGSGVGVALLKRLEDALADRDSIYAVIKGSAINNDGSRRVGFTAPSVEGQCEAIRLARLMAGVEPESISYIECHGTATPIGDPIEVHALKESAGPGAPKNFCALGSVKTNIGHTAEAAGMAGLIKTALALRNRKIPASLHFTSPNPKLELEGGPFYVNDKLRDWTPNGHPLRAGVSSFGIGGSNAHVVVEEAPRRIAEASHRRRHLLTISARSASALETATDQLCSFLSENPQINLADAAFTTHVGRKPFDHRRIVVCRDADDAVKTLKTRVSGRVFSNLKLSSDAPNVAMMFPGLGNDQTGMAADLYQTEPFFRSEMDRYFEFLPQETISELRGILGLDIETGYSSGGTAPLRKPDLRTLFKRAPEVPESESSQRTDLAQLALFLTELALARLWMHWGMRPKALIGYSLGEFTAACVAGVFSPQDALKIVSARAKLIQSLPLGAMLAVPLAERELPPDALADLSIAAVNGPSLVVLSGPLEAIEALQISLKASGVDSRRLQARHALHSPSMASISESFIEVMKQFPASSPQIPYLSNVTGDWIRPEEACNPHYWARHLCGTVRFGDGVEKLCEAGINLFVEVGPGQTLCSLLLQHPACRGTKSTAGLQSLSGAFDTEGDSSVLLTTIGRLWLEGWSPDWTLFHGDERRSRVQLPTYPFERKIYRVQATQGWSVPAVGSAFPATQASAEAPSQVWMSRSDGSNRSEEEEMPLLATGEGILPGTELQQKIATLWHELLGIEEIRIDDNFFKLGGDSLLGTRLISRLKEIFPIELPLRTLIESPTIGLLAETVELLLLQKIEGLSDQEAAELAGKLE
ncbi:MAG TPA: beta-ketoacyl synthase N-terminal-like domain-containing protein [Candidatus Angelobacter sp.]|nr:beta-ketoacyl synthase N-terminal-like domain-containing protein [Candidatus Angelobacter sp.]